VLDSKASTSDPAVVRNLDKHLTGMLEHVVRNSKLDCPPGLIPTDATASQPEGRRDPLKAVDEPMKTMHMQWLKAGSKRAEAGFHDPALGWVTVRAETGPGGVHASILTASQHATQVLDSHIDDLKAHLLGTHAPVQQLTLLRTHEPRLDILPDNLGSQFGPGANPEQKDHHQARSEEQELNRDGEQEFSGRNKTQKPEYYDPPSESTYFDVARLHVSLVA
jgi:hypothetical protein